MNFLINRLDNLDINSKSFEFIPANIKKEINMDGKIVGANGKFVVDQKDMMILIKKSNLKNQIGENMYNAVLRKSMMVFFIPTQADEFEVTQEELDQRYGMKLIHLNNFAQAFSLGCWFIKDSCVTANFIYWVNMFNGYNSQTTRDMPITMSNGAVVEICMTELDMWKSVTADVQYRGHMDRWEIFRGGRTGGSRFFLYADDIPDFDHTWTLYGKRGGCLHTVWRRKGKETAAERVFVVCADRRDLYCFKRVGFCGNGRDPFYTSGAGRDPAAYERIFKDHIFRDHCDIFL